VLRLPLAGYSPSLSHSTAGCFLSWAKLMSIFMLDLWHRIYSSGRRRCRLFGPASFEFNCWRRCHGADFVAATVEGAGRVRHVTR